MAGLRPLNEDALLEGGAPSIQPAHGPGSSPMVNRLLQFLSIRCSHRKLTQPFAASTQATVRRAANSSWDPPTPPTQHYVVCLDCGRKFEYDWTNMRVVDR